VNQSTEKAGRISLEASVAGRGSSLTLCVVGHVPPIEDVPDRGMSQGDKMNSNDLSDSLLCWLVSLKHGSGSIEADVRDALERSENEADFVVEAAAAIRQLMAECRGQLRYLESR